MTYYYKIMFRLCVLLAFAFGGCTVRFKATDIELETETNATYQLDSISVLEEYEVCSLSVPQPLQ